MDEVHDVEDADNDLLGGGAVLCEVFEVVAESLLGLFCQGVGVFGEDSADIDTLIHRKAHNTLESVGFTALDISEEEAGVSCAGAFHEELVHHFADALFLGVGHKLVVGLHRGEDKLVLVDALTFFQTGFLLVEFRRDGHSALFEVVHKVQELGKGIKLLHIVEAD